jgi:hypothetical protein
MRYLRAAVEQINPKIVSSAHIHLLVSSLLLIDIAIWCCIGRSSATIVMISGIVSIGIIITPVLLSLIALPFS